MRYEALAAIAFGLISGYYLFKPALEDARRASAAADTSGPALAPPAVDANADSQARA